MINIQDLTIGQAREIVALLNIGSITTYPNAIPTHPYKIGKNYLIRTVTHYLTGTLVAVYEQELVLINAAWIPDTGRYMQAVATSKFAETEPYPDGMEIPVGRAAIIDAVQISEIPRVQK